MTKFLKILTLNLLVLSFNSCGGTGDAETEAESFSPDTDKTWYIPNKNTTWQWQLSGKLNKSYDVKLYDVDLFDTNISTIEELHKSGKKVICYFSAGSFEDWREDAGKFDNKILGKNLDGWEGEKWLDISSNTVYSIMDKRLELAKNKGCDGVEPDNVDGYINDTGFNLTSLDQLSFNKFLATQAHKRDLSIGLKNDLDQVVELEPYFDFALNESCHEHNECEKLTPFIKANKPVFNAEYDKKYVENIHGQRDDLCKNSLSLGFQTLILPLDLDDSFRYSCNKTDAKLLFKTDFENGVSLGTIEDGYQTIEGYDKKYDFSWAKPSGIHYIDHDDYKAINSEIVTIIGHNGTPTKALYTQENYSTDVTQAPYQITELSKEDGKRDLYIRYWIKMDSKSLKKPDMWRTFFEYKTKDYAQGDGFRLIAFIYTDEDGKPYWHWQGDKNPSTEIWSIDNRVVPVPEDEWFLTEFYWHWGDKKNGRALWRVNGQVIGDHKGETTLNQKPIDFIMLSQLYGDSNPKYQWIDDVEIWSNLRQ